MNNIARRIIAGVSVVALFVSAVGSDAFMGIFGREIYAVSADDRGKTGKSTGFPNLEQDTSGIYYNTGYGLHTNKTATTFGDDGRTFDVNLESWYVGENPVDVATILDASGSMAWTVDTLDPLIIYDKTLNCTVDKLKEKYEISDLSEYEDYPNEETKVLAAIQDKNDGYLPQDVVDCILNPKNTDNSKLSYSDYLYYIYEARSSVSEFVPLGYWDGYTGKISRDEDESLIGFYDFNDRSNRWKNLKSDSSMTHASSTSSSNPGTSNNNNYPTSSGDETAVQIGKTKYNSGGDSAYEGMKLDVSPTVTDGTFEFTISFALKGSVNKDIKGWDIFCIQGDGDKDWYIRVPSGTGNGLAVRYPKSDGSDGGPTSGKSNVFDTEYAFYSFVFYKDNLDGKLYYYLYENGVRNENSKGALGTFKEILGEEGNTIDIIFDPSQYKGSGGNIYIDDIYFFDKALTEEEVANYFGEGGEGDLCESTTYDKGKVKTAVYHAKTVDGDKVLDIAQITDSLYNNPSADERKGWYYVNSHSNWADISGCLESGKQYLGLRNDEYLGKVPEQPEDVGGDNAKETIDETVKAEDIENDNKSIANVPSAWQAASGDSESEYYEAYQKLQAGDDPAKAFTPSENERSIQFYVDSQGFLRCFYCTGDLSWKKSDKTWQYSPRTFCSLVYEKKQYKEEVQPDGTIQRTGNATKYEELNFALNQFYANLAKGSDLSNSAIVRFSTHNLVGKDETSNEKFQSLIMKDWTNWSEYYQSLSDEDKKKGEELKGDYLKDLLIPSDGETSTKTTDSSARPDDIKEYPYTMTGGTYTWTGLKAFYDNMVNTKDLTSGDRVYDIANDARDKYLIIFTDGRDNTVDTTGTDYAGTNKPEGSSVSKESELAEAWADKLKEEGYTIFCVMLATGSISSTANKEEYDKAYKFLLGLAGDKEGKRKAEECVSVVGESDSTLDKAFTDILAKIQQPRQDYTVQDYIDPRFDLVDSNGDVLKLGANGVITKSDGSTVKVGNIIDEINEKPDITEEECKKLGLAYTPIDSYMVNRKETEEKDTYPSGYTNGDGIGTGYIYYDDVKDMYYLRWEDQVIPMENKAFDTNSSDPKKYLDVWSATIRLKAKDDFIGGNDILTNGNEAGENLVYSDSTIKNMDKGTNYELYGFKSDDLVGGKIPYRKKLEVLSGTNRKINAVDAGGVSQAVYGNGIDIPSSGFPRVTVNVRLLPLNAYDLKDVIYMGEVLSPTMMLADLENDYMTGSYYLQYLERYAYRVYGTDADAMPLIELLNKWLKINDKTEASKTFTIPYIYLPDPEYGDDGKLAKDGDKVNIQNSTGASWKDNNIDFDDLNLRDVTGFITYTWKRDDKSLEEQQKMETVDSEGNAQYDITKEYVVKNTNQIKYNLQLKFTPLKENDSLTGFKLDQNFIKADSTGKGGDKFFKIVDGEFNDESVTEWSIDTRSNYLQAMISETKTYEPHVMSDNSDGNEKWVLVDEKTDDFTPSKAVEAYKDADKTGQTKEAVDGENKVTDSGVYDWDADYKKVAGEEQIEGEKLKDYYTGTPNNVGFADKNGATITDENGEFKPESLTDNVYSLVANTTYTKDVVNAALALELVIDGKYLQDGSPITSSSKTYTFIATRYYDDPLDPLPYGEKTTMNADTVETDPTTGVKGKKYRLTFTVDETSLPSEKPQANQIYTVLAKLTKVEVEDSSSSGYAEIKGNEKETNHYLGYTDVDALPIGTYFISTEDTENKLSGNEQFKIGIDDEGATPTDVFFAYLKADSAPTNYTYNKFPKSVYDVSPDAATDTGDPEYLIKNGTNDNSSKNIAENAREVTEAPDDNQKLTFYFGTDKSTNSKGLDKGESIYTKDRLGIIILSKNNNSLSISKKVTHVNDTEKEDAYKHEWEFTVTFKPVDVTEFETTNTSKGFALTWYEFDETSNSWIDDATHHTDTPSIKFKNAGDVYTATLKLKHNEKVMIKDLPEGKWQVEETDERGSTLLYSAHNNMDADKNDYEFSNMTYENIPLNPGSYVDYVNEFPYELPSAGGIGTNILIYSGITFMLLSGLSFAILCKKGRSRDKPKG